MGEQVLKAAGVDHLTKTERNALYRARGLRDSAARRADIMANGTEEAKRTLKNVDKYFEDGFASHSRKINAALKAYRDKHGKDSDTPEVVARIRLGFGSGPTKRHESRARAIVKDDLPVLAKNPKSRYATDNKRLSRTKGTPLSDPKFIENAKLDIKAAAKGRDALIVRLCLKFPLSGWTKSPINGSLYGTQSHASGRHNHRDSPIYTSCSP
jgi:hypothetical protein